MTPTKNEEPNYSHEIQSLLISYMLADADAFVQSQNILKDIYFDPRLRASIRYIQEYSEHYKTLPQVVQVRAATDIAFDDIATSPQHREWFLKTIESFAKHRALEIAVMEGVDLIKQSQGGELEKRIKDALSITLMNDLGTDYFDNPVKRIEQMKDNSALYSTGWKSLDEKLFGGFSKGGLNIFLAGSGVGKSVALANVAANWVLQGKHVAYITLELSEDLVANRFDAMFAGVSTKEVLSKSKEIGLKVKMIGMKSAGSLRIKRLPESSTTANDIRAYLKEYEIRTGHKPDCLVIDYLDLMAPLAKVDLTNVSIKDKYVSEEVRALMTEWDLLGCTASQLNRSSIEASEFDHSHVAGGLSKIQTSDIAIGIMAPAAWKENGRWQLQLLKTRSSSGIGAKIEMAYDSITMRVTDRPDTEVQQESLSSDEMRAQLQAKTENRNKIAARVDEVATGSVSAKKAGLDILSLMQQTTKRAEL